MPSSRSRTDLDNSKLRDHLASLLEHKTAQLQTLGSMGQEILRQQQELEERIRLVEEDAEDEVGEETREKLAELEEAMQGWEMTNESMLKDLGSRVCGISFTDSRMTILVLLRRLLIVYRDVNEMRKIKL
jgi:hypothetical protein